MAKYDFLIAGAGIFGITTAVELARKNYKVAVINPDNIPHPLAASTDISKAVRMEYGNDLEYMEMAIKSIDKWKGWNEWFNDVLYYEVGYVMISSSDIAGDTPSFEQDCYHQVNKRGFVTDLMDAKSISKLYPVFNLPEHYSGFFNPVGGFAASGKTVSTLTAYARELGVDVLERQTAYEILLENNRACGIKTREGDTFLAGEVVICAGNFTPYLLPELMPFFRVTGHPVFHLKTAKPELCVPPALPVFALDISRTGWYGFPLHPSEQVVKIANHGEGLVLHPEKDERIVYPEDEAALRSMLDGFMPELATDPIVYTRRCCYTDTLDGHFWIDRHPEIEGLTVGSGGSGHGLKMAPVIGEMIAATAMQEKHGWSDRFGWRELSPETKNEEGARFKK